jgi:DNA-directed RNA polymerase specialized sigma24 family protein
VSGHDLLTGVWRWVLKLSHQYGHRLGIDPGDVANETALRVLEKAHKYDPAKARPTVWVQKVCWRVALNLAGKGLVPGRRKRLDTSGWTDPESVYGTSRESIPGEGDERGREIEDAKCEAAAVLARLPMTDRRMLEARYGIGNGRECDLAEVGRRHNVSKQRACQRVTAALALLRGTGTVVDRPARPAVPRGVAADEDVVAAVRSSPNGWATRNGVVRRIRAAGRAVAPATVSAVLDRLVAAGVVKRSSSGFRLAHPTADDAGKAAACGLTVDEWRRRYVAALAAAA